MSVSSFELALQILNLNETTRGEYFEPPSKRAKPSKLSQDEQLAKDLWELSEKLVKEKCGGLA